MPTVASIARRVRYATFFIATWLLPLSFAHANPAANSATSTELESHIWRILFVAFEPRSGRGPDSEIAPGGDNGSDAYLSFENGEIGGSLGCGKLTGRYNLLRDRVQISAVWNDGAQRCSSEFRRRTRDFITALNGVVRLEGKDDGAFHLFDEQKNYFVRLELLSPGADFLETRGTFWRLVNLEGNTIAEPNAEIRFGEGQLQISFGNKFSEEYSVSYNPKKISFRGHWSPPRQRYRDLSPLFETFEKSLYNIASYTVNNDQLVAFDSSGRRTMLLERIHSTGLEYRFWRILEYATELGMRQTIGPPRAHIITFAQGKVQGTAACTGYQGDYTVAGDSLSVRASEITLAGYCSRFDRDEDLLVVKALNKASRVTQDGTRVLLQDNQGNTSIVLVPYSQQISH